MEHNTKDAKIIAQEFDLKFFMLSQLSRDLEKRPLNDRRPKLSDLRDNGAAELDADKVLFTFPNWLYKLDYIDGSSCENGVGEILVGKNRQSKPKAVKSWFNFNRARLENYG